MKSDEAMQFLTRLFPAIGPGESIETRVKDTNGRVTRDMFADVEELCRMAADKAAHNDVFFGVALRDRKGGKRENIVRVTAAWADLDAKDEQDDPRNRLQGCPVQPSAVVNSGKGIHAYWFLSEPIGRDRLDELEQLNKMIARAVGGDSVYDAPRMLRVPGTLNHKYGEPLSVVLDEINEGLRYTIEHLFSAFGRDAAPAAVLDAAPLRHAPCGAAQDASALHSPDTAQPVEAARDTPQPRHAQPRQSPPAADEADPAVLPCRAKMWRGVSQGWRNNACLQLAVDLRRNGLSEGIALSTLLSWARHCLPPLDVNEVRGAVRSAFEHSYTGLGCDKSPMKDLCSSQCPVAAAPLRHAPCGAAQDASALHSPDTVQSRHAEPVEAAGGTSPETGETEVPILRLLTVDDLLQVAREPIRFVVDRVVPAAGISMISGEGGIGKSFVVMDLAFAVATGTKFLGRFDCEQGAVLLLDLENDKSIVSHRLLRIGTGRGTWPDRPPICVADKQDESYAELRLDSERGRAIVLKTAKECRAKLMVIDPLVSIHYQDENSNVAMRQMTMALEHISRECGLAVVVVHHHRKRGQVNDAGQMMRGASDLRNAVVSHLSLKRISRGKLLAEHDKCRPMEELEDFVIEVKDTPEGDGTTVRHIGDSNCMSAPTIQARARELIVQYLTDHGPSRRKDMVEFLQGAGISFDSAVGAVKWLARCGVITAACRGTYDLTEDMTTV